MSPRICTSCKPHHLTTDWYKIEAHHPRGGQIECGPAHEDRVRREVRNKMDPAEADELGYVTSRPPRPKRLAV